MKIELNDFELELIIAVIHLQRATLAPVPSNDLQRNVLKSVEDNLKKYLLKGKVK